MSYSSPGCLTTTSDRGRALTIFSPLTTTLKWILCLQRLPMRLTESPVSSLCRLELHLLEPPLHYSPMTTIKPCLFTIVSTSVASLACFSLSC